MGKNLTLTLIFLAAIPAVSAGESPKRYYEVAVSTKPPKRVHVDPVIEDLPQEKPKSLAKKKGLLQAIEDIDAPDMRKRVKKTISVIEGDNVVNDKHTVSIPKRTEWRVLWILDTADGKSRGDFTLRVDFPPGTTGSQQFSKTLMPMDDGMYGALNICELGGGEFPLTIDSNNIKWRLEIQTVK